MDQDAVQQVGGRDGAHAVEEWANNARTRRRNAPAVCSSELANESGRAGQLAHRLTHDHVHVRALAADHIGQIHLLDAGADALHADLPLHPAAQLESCHGNHLDGGAEKSARHRDVGAAGDDRAVHYGSERYGHSCFPSMRMVLETITLMLRKAHAWSLLRWRGQPMPPLEELPILAFLPQCG